MAPLALLLGLVLTAGAFFTVETARADGALVIGDCGAYGYSFNYKSESEATDRAMKECRDHNGKNCKAVATLSGNCAAFATDRSRSCGAWGWATRSSRGAAENEAVAQCRKYGGKNCRVRTQFCDSQSTPPAPALTTNWTSTTLGQKECLQRAERVVRDAGLNRNFEVVGQSVFGEQGDFTAQVRCITEKGVVIFVIVGPKLDGARVHMKALFDHF